MLNPDDFDLVRSLAEEHADHPIVIEACTIQKRYFATESSPGVVLLRTAWRDAGEQLGDSALRQILAALETILPHDHTA